MGKRSKLPVSNGCASSTKVSTMLSYHKTKFSTIYCSCMYWILHKPISRCKWGRMDLWNICCRTGNRQGSKANCQSSTNSSHILLKQLGYKKATRCLFLDVNGNVWKCDSRREKYKQGPRKIGKSKLPPIKSISAASRFSLFLDHEGNVWSQGRSKQGCLGFEDTLFQRCPTKIPNLCNIVEISSSDNCSMFLDGDGTVWACGDDHYYVYVNLQSNRPCKIKGLPPIRAISVGYRHWLFLDEKGRVWGLGLNKFRVFGSVRNSHDKRVVYIQKPILVTGLGEIVAIEAGTHASLYIEA